MTMFNTTLGSSLRDHLTDLSQYLQQQHNLDAETLISTPYPSIVGISSTSRDIQAFKLPLYNASINKTFIDTRTSLNKDNGIKNLVEYQNAMKRAVFEQVWNTDRGSLENISTSVSAVWATWITGLLSSRFSLNFNATGAIKIYLFCYYYSLFKTDEKYDFKKESANLAKQLQIHFKYPMDFISATLLTETDVLGQKEMTILDVLNQTDKYDLSSIQLSSILKFIVAVGEGVYHLPMLNPTFLINLVSSGSWVGPDSHLFTGLSLEYPPAFIPLAYTALELSFYKKTRIGFAVQEMSRINKRRIDGIEDFSKSLMRDMKSENEE